MLVEDIFRQANDRILQAAEEHAVDMRVPYICELADYSQVILLSVDQYRAVRADPARFLNKAGHESADRGAANVVGRHDGYVVVEVGACDVR